MGRSDTDPGLNRPTGARRWTRRPNASPGAARVTSARVPPSALADQYERQDRWRRWDEALSRVPITPDQRVLDLGCGVGHVTARLARLGARVTGVDLDQDLLTVARARCPGVRFERTDVSALTPATFGPVDGIWSSFVAAYFPDLDPLVAAWSRCLAPGGWCALVEVEDLLGHGPLAPELTAEIPRFYDSARLAGRYDFLSGARLAQAARQAGLRVVSESVLPDDELSFDGPADPDVLTAWRLRLARMGGLQAFLGPRFPAFERGFLEALASPEHRTSTRVVLVVATTA